MNVTLLTHTSNPERMVAAAAKLCYSGTTIDELMDGLDDEKNAAFVEMLAGLGHESPIEHASFTFAIEGVSRALLAQITRHRIASFSVQSQRYVEANGFAGVVPPAVADSPEAHAVFEGAMRHAEQAYRDIAGILLEKHERALLDTGEPPKSARAKAEKLAIEDARFVLPNACETKMIVTMNARSLLNFFRLRCCNRAQWEIRAVADRMLALVRGAAPSLFAKAGPPCLRGACGEGRMSCGRIDDVRTRYARLGREDGV